MDLVSMNNKKSHEKIAAFILEKIFLNVLRDHQFRERDRDLTLLPLLHV
jgi:hypothetical protein